VVTQLPVLLLVDDDPRLLRALGIALSRRFTLLTAPNVEEATLTLRAFRVQAVVTDFHLPDGTGLDVLREASASSPAALRVLMSASEDALNTAESQALANVTVLKPFNVAQAGRLIAALVAAAKLRGL
jgi:DNA-binding NtrC family response regulator